MAHKVAIKAHKTNEKTMLTLEIKMSDTDREREKRIYKKLLLYDKTFLFPLVSKFLRSEFF